MATTTVHSYHINVDHGDSAIHLLVTNATPHQILSAVLIDGARPGHEADICRVIRHIRQSRQYDCSLQRNDDDLQTMRFDSIVVTHWDIDHWGGIKALLENDLRAQLQALVAPEIARSNAAYVASRTAKFGSDPIEPDSKNPSWNKLMEWIELEVSGATSATWDTIQSALHDVALKSRFMKYATATTGPTAFPTTTALVQSGSGTPSASRAVTAGMLQTTFYCPYSFTARNVGTTQTDIQTGLSFFRPTFDAEYTVGSRHTNMMCLALFAEYTLNIPRPQRNISGYSAAAPVQSRTLRQLWNFVNVCKLRADSDSYLGMELFNNVSPPTPYTGFTSPTLLANAFLGAEVSSFSAQGFGLFIVSGDQRIVGQTALTGPDRPPGEKPTGPWGISRDASVNLISKTGGSQINRKAPLIRVVNTGVDGRFPGQSYQRSSPEDMNSPSIGCVLLAVPRGSTVVETPLVLHFTAGDALYDTEASIARWLTNNGTKPISIPVMKLSQ
jgi:hypothetical protein